MSGFYWPEPDLSFLPGTKASGKARRVILFAITTTSCSLLTKTKHGVPLLAKSLVSSTEFMSITWECWVGRECFAVQVSEPGTAAFANLRMNIQNIDQTLFNLAGRALQVCDWYRSHQFCGRCGKATTDSKETVLLCVPGVS